MDENKNTFEENTTPEAREDNRPSPPPTPPQAPRIDFTQPEYSQEEPQTPPTPRTPPQERPRQPVRETPPTVPQEEQPLREAPEAPPQDRYGFPGQEMPNGFQPQTPYGNAQPAYDGSRPQYMNNQPPYSQAYQYPGNPRQPAPYQQQYYRAPSQPGDYRMPYRAEPAPKQPMSGGQKAFVAIVIAILAASLIAFVVFTAANGGKTEQPKAPQPFDNGGGAFEFPTEAYTLPQDTEPEGKDGSYPESDARDKVNKDYKGLTLNKKPSKIDPDKYGSEYAFKSVEKSVVGIICYTDGQEGTTTSYSSMGSGIVISADGYIVTNSHIISDSRTAYKIKIVTNDKKEYKAGVVGYDNRTDIAVLKADAKDMTPAEFGDSAENKVTEDVIAVGNPRSLAYQNSVTKGIISAIDRETSASNISKLIQTDAAINPGNSGGPLCNMYGYVIGITSSKIVLDEYEAMSFAIPSQTVKEIVDDIIKNGFVSGRVKIGIMGRVYYDSESKVTGIEINSISKGGPLDGTGAQKGDVITKLNGTKIDTFSDIYNELGKHKAGDEVNIELYRPETQKTYKISVKLQADKSE